MYCIYIVCGGVYIHEINVDNQVKCTNSNLGKSTSNLKPVCLGNHDFYPFGIMTLWATAEHLMLALHKMSTT